MSAAELETKVSNQPAREDGFEIDPLRRLLSAGFGAAGELVRRWADPGLGAVVDPQLLGLVRFTELTRKPRLETLGVDGARRSYAELCRLMGQAGDWAGEIDTITVAGAAGPLEARVYRPAGAPRPSPCMVYFHGGGFVVGDLDTHDPICRFIAAESGVAVVAVAYRLAPEAVFPAAHDDGLASYIDICARAAELGFAPQRIFVGGDSAGGDIALGLCHALAGTGAEQPVGIWALYPATDVSPAAPEAKAREEIVIPMSTILWFRDTYVTNANDRTDPRVSPLLSDRLSKFPQTRIATAAFDVLADQGEAMAAELARAGVDVAASHADGLPHAYGNLLGVLPSARAATAEAAAWLTKAAFSQG